MEVLEKNEGGPVGLVDERVLVQFRTVDGETTGPQLDVPRESTPEQLKQLVNRLLQNEEELPYAFYANDVEITRSLHDTVTQLGSSWEQVVQIRYQPEAVFRVRPVTRCTSSMQGHTEAVLTASFSPDSKQLATGSGDTTVRLWDLNTQLPLRTLRGHRNWVLVVAWAPDGRQLASAGMDSEVRVWDPESGASTAVLRGHVKWVTALAWEPLHLQARSCHVASAGKDSTVRLWDIERGICVRVLSGHTASVTCLRWSGDGVVMSGSQDRTVKLWNTEEGKLIRTLEGHAHWVNHMALSSDYVMRTGALDEKGLLTAEKRARERYEAAVGKGRVERLATASDDFTIFLWEPLKSKKPMARLTGHMKPINFVSFSPDGNFLASASFDSLVKLWDGRTGRFLCNLRAHVGAVYMLCWSSDSRILVSASKDSTLKLWDVKRQKLKMDLPGHADEVYAIDWSPDGQMVASGSKDRLVKLWHH